LTRKPKISVVMAAYNAEKYIEAAKESVLTQTFSDWEFIIINDGSKDNTIETIQKFKDERIKIINQINMGAANARNNGIKLSKSNLIAILDSDDIFYPEKLQIQYDYMNENSNCIAVGSNADIIDHNGHFIYTTNNPLISEELKKRLPYKSPFIHSTVMFRKKHFLKAGMYPNIRIAQDLFLFNNMAFFGEFANIKRPLIKYRILPSGSTRRNKKTIKSLRDSVNYYHVTRKLENYHIKRIERCYSSLSKNEKYYQYHLLIAKKYLWNNYQPQLSRKNLSMALRYKYFSIEPYLMYIFSFLPESIINKIYNEWK